VGVIAYPDPDRQIRGEGAGFRLASLEELGVAPLLELQHWSSDSSPTPFSVDGEIWYGLNLPLRGFEQTDARILIAISAWELLREARALLRHQIVWAAGLVLAVLMLGWVLGLRLGRDRKSVVWGKCAGASMRRAG